MSDIELYVFVIVFTVAVVAGCVDAIAGGGGLLTVPALLLVGFDPVTAIATNKLQGSAGALSATFAFARKGLIDWRIGLPMALVAAFAAVLGAFSVNALPRPFVSAVLPFILIMIALYFVFAPKMGHEDARARISSGVFMLAVVPFIGFYDGIFGPGAGSFYMVAFVGLLGYGVVKATAHTKLTNAAGNLGGLCFFASTGAINWKVGFIMAIGAFVGAQFGSKLAMSMGIKLIRPLLVVICLLMTIRLLLDTSNPIRLFISRI